MDYFIISIFIKYLFINNLQRFREKSHIYYVASSQLQHKNNNGPVTQSAECSAYSRSYTYEDNTSRNTKVAGSNPARTKPLIFEQQNIIKLFI